MSSVSFELSLHTHIISDITHAGTDQGLRFGPESVTERERRVVTSYLTVNRTCVL